MPRSWTIVLGIVLLGVTILPPPRTAIAIPAFARQTGLECSGCHVGGFYPELNHFGRMFKANSYSLKSPEQRPLPYEILQRFAMAQELSYTAIQKSVGKALTKNEGTNFFVNENAGFSLPQQASFFYGGQIYKKLGAFVMGTYDATDDAWAVDTTDVRYADTVKLGDQTLLYGITMNNGPTIEDLWNTTPTWSFPYASSEIAPGPAAGTFIGGIGQQVAGAGPYLMWNQTAYLAVTPYFSGRSGIFSPLTAGTPKEQIIDHAAPYWRLAVFHDEGAHDIEVGTFGAWASAHASGSEGPKNRYLDLGEDLQYQYSTNPHSFTLKASLLFEAQHNDGSVRLGEAEHAHDPLLVANVNASYYYQNVVGVTLGYFSISGRSDSGLYAPDPIDGSRNGKPHSEWGVAELDFLPFSRFYRPVAYIPAVAMTKLSLQYVFYGPFNGQSANYDGAGRNGSDNNTFFALLWVPW